MGLRLRLEEKTMTKIDVVSGFLGAGKTTLIKKLLKEALDGSKTVLIENEFGEIGIDGGFLKEAGIEIKEMNSGCICCSLVGDFGTSLKEVISTYAPERILIEPSGVGKLSDVLKAVENVAGDLDVEINDDDLRIDTYRSSGAGGQHINKTSSAIRITHLPTGIVVQCQNERSQFQNKDKAMQMLKAKLYMLKQQENEEKISGIRGEVKDIAWGNQIRSYVLQPYTMVKDHRTGASSGNAGAVLDGDIDLFISAYLRWLSTGEKVSEDTGE